MSGTSDAAARFRALAEHPDLPRLLAEPAQERTGARELLRTVLALVLFCFVGVLAALVVFSFCPPLGFVVLAPVGFGLYAVVRELRGRADRPSGPVLRAPALVVEENTKLEEHRALARTRHRATLEFVDGSRRELEVTAFASASLRSGALGVAEIAGDVLVAFTRLQG